MDVACQAPFASRLAPTGDYGVPRGSEKAHRVDVVAHQQVFGLLIMVEHHLVVFTADTGLLVATERRMRRVQVVAVGPDPPGLDRPAHAVGAVDVAGPQAGAETEL